MTAFPRNLSSWRCRSLSAHGPVRLFSCAEVQEAEVSIVFEEPELGGPQRAGGTCVGSFQSVSSVCVEKAGPGETTAQIRLHYCPAG